MKTKHFLEKLNDNKDDIYTNIFILLKMLYLGNEYSKNDIYIPSELMKSKDLTFLNLMGYNENFAKNYKNLGNLIITSQKVIDEFFHLRDSNVIDENQFIPHKFDLYISLLTCIYYYLLPKDSHNDIFTRILFEINKNNNNEKMNDLIVSSTIYNFKNIPINMYNQFYKNVVIDDDEKIKILVKHLTLIYDFYNNYILNYLINTIDYKIHPLENLRYTFSEQCGILKGFS